MSQRMNPGEHSYREGYITREGWLTSEGAVALANLEGPFAIRVFDAETGEELKYVTDDDRSFWGVFCAEHGWSQGTGRFTGECPHCKPDDPWEESA